MNSNEIRQSFFDFFESKMHKIVNSAPMVIKDDPTLMFTNAGMNQFKNIFLSELATNNKRIANSQKCLRVSGKHNDLEEVGHDTYHHTMFEMLGNWSFGDYFKKDAINWGWEYLTKILDVPIDRLYATIFEGDKKEGLATDNEAKNFWKEHLPEERILNGSKKDNFWEMGETGPCGPCSEIHIDLRNETERSRISGAELVNKNHNEVIEIWNLVFIQYNRKKGGQLEELPERHIDTGMGFERLCMVVQGKKSNYDTDVFQPIIKEIGKLTDYKYKVNKQTDTAMQVVADHLRTIAFSITDGQLPSNTGAGYVIRRILRRAVRYAYTFLDVRTPFICKLTDSLINVMGYTYPELVAQKNIIEKVIRQEEISFLRTLETGIKLLDKIIKKTKKANYLIVDGTDVFTLYDAYGFPYDLTELILREHNLLINKKTYDDEMLKQKMRSKKDAQTNKDDWIVLFKDDIEEFIGYDHTETYLKITRYRKVQQKNKNFYHLVFNYTPFYAESGGQTGDTGYIEANGIRTEIIDTQNEHNVIIHITKKLPTDISCKFHAVVNKQNRELIMNNHSATHLMHRALQDVLGKHVEQKGSLVDTKHLRFDFSHFRKMTDNEILKVENNVNRKIRLNIKLEESRTIPLSEAKKMGATALFGEKYGDIVRVIKFADSIELCGGNHVEATGKIGFFKIISETAIAAGIRRIEAITSITTEKYITKKLDILNDITKIFKSSKNIKQSIEKLLEENKTLKKKIENFENEKIKIIKQSLKNDIKQIKGVNVISGKIEVSNAGQLRDLAFRLKADIENLFFVAGAEINGKANLTILISNNLTKERNLNAGKIIRNISKEIKGGGGGQANFASAGGKYPDGINKAIKKALDFL